MNSHLGKTQQNKNQSISNGESQLKSRGESTLQFIDNRSEAVAQKRLQAMLCNSPRTMQNKAHQKTAKGTISQTSTLLQQAKPATPSSPV